MLDRSHFGIENDNNLNIVRYDQIPVLKIAIIEKRDTVDFKIVGRFSIVNDQGIAIFKRAATPAKWRLTFRSRQQAKYEYGILLEKFRDQKAAREQEYKLIEKGIGARLKSLGSTYFLNNKLIGDNIEHRLVVDKLGSEQEAIKLAKNMFSNLSWQIFREKLCEPHALLELFDGELEKLNEAEDCIRIIPEAAKIITYIYNLSTGTPSAGLANYGTAIRGPIEFRYLGENSAAIICEMTLEDYVKNVVARQMLSDFPEEIIKAQAIVVRSKAAANLNINHFDDRFDFCSAVHCQPFAGLAEIPAKLAKAVDDTCGLVLTQKKQVIQAEYTAICGGRTESHNFMNTEINGDLYPSVWDGENLEGIEHYENLSQEQKLRQWIMDAPAVFCNLNHQAASNMLNWFKNNFRWQFSYGREELEQIISQIVGANIGSLFEIVPIKRSLSGRLLEIEILASNMNLVIKNSDEICRLFKSDGLPSSCFVIDTSVDEAGFPSSFRISGAGVGHGIGLCQAGGTAMALKGFHHSAILKHYFGETNLQKIYEVTS